MSSVKTGWREDMGVPTETGRDRRGETEVGVGGWGVRRTEEEKKGCWKVGMPVIERRARGEGARLWWAIRVAMKKPGFVLVVTWVW